MVERTPSTTAPGHWIDTGAGWLASFYPDTLALLDELGHTGLLSPMKLRGGGDLMLDGKIVPTPNSVRRIATTRLLGPADKLRFFAYMSRLVLRQPGNLRVDLDHDGERAVDELQSMGDRARDRIVRPNFEGPFFARLEEMSAALVRAWLRCLATGTFFHVDGGMDAPWRAARRDTGRCAPESPSTRSSPRHDHVEISHGGATERFDGAVVAVPAPVAAAMVGQRTIGQPGSTTSTTSRTCASTPPVAARVPTAAAFTCFPTTSWPPSNSAAARWAPGGRSPPTGSGRSSVPLRHPARRCSTNPADQVTQRLWEAARTIEPRLFSLDDAEIVQLIRWRHAVPAVHPGYFTRLRSFTQRPPLVFAGDWLVQPCVEGAVRSGNAAASCFIDSHNR